MAATKIVSVLGTGWLGIPLVRSLSEAGVPVRGSYRRPGGQEEVIEAGGAALPIDLPGDIQALPNFLDQASGLVITLPPGGRQWGSAATDRYLGQLSALSPYLREDLHVIFTSSTGVYGNAQGTVTEETPVAPDTDSGRAVVAAENWLAAEVTGPLTILRLGGLYGPQRDPVRFFRRRDAIPDGDAPVNMLHLHQAVAALRFVIERRIDGTFNVCGGDHPTKREFYGALYHAAGLPAKPFLPGGSSGKRIDSSKIRRLGWPSL